MGIVTIEDDFFSIRKVNFLLGFNFLNRNSIQKENVVECKMILTLYWTIESKDPYYASICSK